MKIASPVAVLAAALTGLLLTACDRNATPGTPVATAPASGAASGTAAPAAPASGPPVSVSTVRAAKRDVDVMLDATGTVTALNSVDVRSQFSSTIAQVHIREGQFVKKGDTLFTLDARTETANVAKARAQVQKDEAALADAQRQLVRSKDLLAQNFVSQVAVDTNQTLVDSQRAVLAADRAALDAALVAQSLARIVAPGAGRAGAINVYPGSYVSPTTPLVTITQLDPIAVSFSLPQRNLGDALQSLRSGGGGKVEAVLPEGKGSLTGKLQFVDSAVDAGSGTVKVKAVFGNGDEKLWPGAFVGVKLVVQTLKDAIQIPQASIVQGQRGKIVFVVNAENKVAVRPIEMVHAAGVDAVVTGLRPGEKVITDGRQNVRPGSTVIERAAEPRGGASGAAGGRRGGGASAPARAGSNPLP